MEVPFSIDLAFITAEAQRRADDYEAFGYYIEIETRSDAELDTLVDTIAAPIIRAVDCTQCANCCRTLDVYLTPDDAARLAQAIFIPLDTLVETYLDQAQPAVDEWGMFKQRPCPFLRENLCSIYPHRPESCRAYPTFTPDFRWAISDILGGVGSCPIIYHVIEALQVELGWK